MVSIGSLFQLCPGGLKLPTKIRTNDDVKGILAGPPPKLRFPPEIAGLIKGLLTIGFP